MLPTKGLSHLKIDTCTGNISKKIQMSGLALTLRKFW